MMKKEGWEERYCESVEDECCRSYGNSYQKKNNDTKKDLLTINNGTSTSMDTEMINTTFEIWYVWLNLR